MQEGIGVVEVSISKKKSFPYGRYILYGLFFFPFVIGELFFRYKDRNSPDALMNWRARFLLVIFWPEKLIADTYSFGWQCMIRLFNILFAVVLGVIFLPYLIALLFPIFPVALLGIFTITQACALFMVLYAAFRQVVYVCLDPSLDAEPPTSHIESLHHQEAHQRTDLGTDRPKTPRVLERSPRVSPANVVEPENLPATVMSPTAEFRSNIPKVPSDADLSRHRASLPRNSLKRSRSETDLDLRKLGPPVENIQPLPPEDLRETEKEKRVIRGGYGGGESPHPKGHPLDDTREGGVAVSAPPTPKPDYVVSAGMLPRSFSTESSSLGEIASPVLRPHSASLMSPTSGTSAGTSPESSRDNRVLASVSSPQGLSRGKPVSEGDRRQASIGSTSSQESWNPRISLGPPKVNASQSTQNLHDHGQTQAQETPLSPL